MPTSDYKDGEQKRDTRCETTMVSFNVGDGVFTVMPGVGLNPYVGSYT